MQISIRSGSRIVCLAIGGDLLDMYWRRKFVERKTMRINDADTVAWREPNPSIWRLCHKRWISVSYGVASHTIRSVEHLRLYDSAGISSPGIQFVLRDAHQATSHVQ